MELTKEEFMRRREFVAGSLAGLGLTVAAPFLDGAARLEWERQSEDADSIVARHGVWFTYLPAWEHLPRLLRDFAHLDKRSRVYLAGITGETLSSLGDTRHAIQWFKWANENYQSPGQAEWLHTRNSIVALEAELMHYVRPSIGIGACAHALAQAKLGRREEAVISLNRAQRNVSEGDSYSIFTFPIWQWHRFGSGVHARLGNVQAARDHQHEALKAYPESDVTSRAMVNFDAAETYARAGQVDRASTHLYTTLVGLSPNNRYDVLLRRASEVYDLIPG